MKPIFIAAALVAFMAGSASAETFRSPVSRDAYGAPQIDIAFGIMRFPGCHWSLTLPSGFVFSRGSPDGGNLRGSPGRGSYDFAVNYHACQIMGSTVEPSTRWHEIVIY